MNTDTKKIFSILVIIILIVIVGFVCFRLPEIKNYFASHSSQSVNKVDNHIFDMAGKVVGLKDNTIVVEGKIGLETKKVVFIITPDTIFKKTGLQVNRDQIKSGKPFKPEISQVSGTSSDIKIGTQIVKINSKESLGIDVEKQKTAIEINYSTHEITN